jgi:predicted esterase
MKKTLFLLLWMVILADWPAFAQSPFEPLFGPFVLENVTYGKALNYNNREVALTLDLHIPAVGRRHRYPLLVMVHGGGFVDGSRKEGNIPGWVNYFVNRGYVVANVSYRLGYISLSGDFNCNILNAYPCTHAADTAEWYRAWYRGVQDVKGAIRFLVNHADVYQIDPERVFLFGESAGGFIVNGVAFLDVAEEKPVFAGPMPPLPKPTGGFINSCPHYQSETFSSDVVARPDLGGIEGDIEWPSRPYTIRGVASIYGGMFYDLLQRVPPGKHKPVIYQFHRACDIVVPIDCGVIYYGTSWCIANCAGCGFIYNAPIACGSRAISNWNQQKGYGYVFRNDFTPEPFPYNCIFLSHNCLEQVNNPCHAPSGFNIHRVEEFFRQQWLAEEEMSTERASDHRPWAEAVGIGPNPFSEVLYVRNSALQEVRYRLMDAQGSLVSEGTVPAGEQLMLPTQHWPRGVYFFHAQETTGGWRRVSRLVKAE